MACALLKFVQEGARRRKPAGSNEATDTSSGSENEDSPLVAQLGGAGDAAALALLQETVTAGLP